MRFDIRYRIEKRKENVVWWLARHTPRSIRYWIVVQAAVEVEPHENPSNVTAVQMMDVIKPTKGF